MTVTYTPEEWTVARGTIRRLPIERWPWLGDLEGSESLPPWDQRACGGSDSLDIAHACLVWLSKQPKRILPELCPVSAKLPFPDRRDMDEPDGAASARVAEVLGVLVGIGGNGMDAIHRDLAEPTPASIRRALVTVSAMRDARATVAPAIAHKRKRGRDKADFALLRKWITDRSFGSAEKLTKKDLAKAIAGELKRVNPKNIPSADFARIERELKGITPAWTQCDGRWSAKVRWPQSPQK